MNLQTEPLDLKEATITCIPRLRGGGGVGRLSRRGGGGSPAAPAQVSVLDRVRDVVLRLAMLSAATLPAIKGGGATTRRPTTSTPSRVEAARVSPAASAATPYTDSYWSEAVDDCIEFLKQSAAGAYGHTSSAASARVVSTVAASPLRVPRHVIEQ